MKFSPIQRAILRGIIRDRDRLAALPWDCPGHSSLGSYRVAITDAREGLVRPELADWLGRAPTNADCIKASRAYEKLHQLDLIVRHGDRRTVHLSLTPAGEKIARKLAGLPAAPSPAPESPIPAA
jgi:hypothetical protein